MRHALICFALVAVVPGCASSRIDRDRTPVAVEAVVVSYGEDHFIAHGPNFEVVIDQRIPASHLEVRRPQGPFDRRLVIYSEKPLPESHPLRQIGAVVEFTIERKYLVGLFLDPSKPRDTPSLKVEAVRALEKKQPNKAPEPTPTAVTPRAMEMKSEMKHWIPEWNEARVVPAAGVAHL
jgi:hypothetical protein